MTMECFKDAVRTIQVIPVKCGEQLLIQNAKQDIVLLAAAYVGPQFQTAIKKDTMAVLTFLVLKEL